MHFTADVDSMEKAAKEKLFRELYQLDQESEGEEDSSNASVMLSRCKLPTSRHRVGARITQATILGSSSLSRTVSSPLPEGRSTPRRRNGPLNGLSFSVIPSSVIEERHSTERTALPTLPTTMAKPSGKRKRGQSFETKPESQQLFKGLSFCVPTHV